MDKRTTASRRRALAHPSFHAIADGEAESGVSEGKGVLLAYFSKQQNRSFTPVPSCIYNLEQVHIHTSSHKPDRSGKVLKPIHTADAVLANGIGCRLSLTARSSVLPQRVRYIKLQTPMKQKLRTIVP